MALAAGVFFTGLSGGHALGAASLFADPNLATAVGSALGKPANSLNPADLPNLFYLSALNLQITNLAGLGGATNLAGLYLNGNAIQDLAPLLSCGQLAALELEQNQVIDLSPLSGLTNLSCLSLGNNPITNYWVISNLTHLANLTVRVGAFSDLTPLRGLYGLQTLVLWHNQIANVSPLAGLTNLSRLDLRWNGATNTPLSAVLPANLASLYLGGNALSNAPALSSLRQLSFLNLDDNWIRDVSPLTNASHLAYLSLNRNPAANVSVLTNLSSLASLELRGDGLTNVMFLSGLPNLTYADLAYNRLSNSASLPNLGSLVVGDNPITSLAMLSTLTRTTNLWLFGDGIADANVLSSLPGLRYLNLEQTGLTDLTSLSGLTNLTGLALSGNPQASYASLAGLTRLTSLRLEGDALTDCGVVANFPGLSFLSLSQNQLTDLAPVNGLTNLHDLYLRRNELNIATNLLLLPNLVQVDLSLNPLQLSSTFPDLAGTNSLPVIQELQARPAGAPPCGCAGGTNEALAAQSERVNVTYLPTNPPPIISVLQHWYIPCNATSSLPVQAFEFPTPAVPLSVYATSANPALVSILNPYLPATNGQFTLSVLSGCDAISNATPITLTAVDDVHLSATIRVQVTVVPSLSVASLCPNADTNLVAALAAASGQTAAQLGAVDLLRLNSLQVENASLGDPCLWTWLTNLTSLYLSGSSVSHLDFLTNLAQLTAVELDTSSVTNLAPLQTLPSLSYLRLYSDPEVDLSPLRAGFSNLTSLDVTGDGVADISFLTNLSSLLFLKLDDNRITDLSPVRGLTELQSLYVQQDLVTNLAPLAALTNLGSLDVRLNLLDLSPNSAALGVLTGLTNPSIAAWPQRGPPMLGLPGEWFIAANATSSIPVGISDNAFYGAQFTAGMKSSNSGLLPNANLVLSPGPNGAWSLTAIPVAGQAGNAMVVVNVTNDAGLTASGSFPLTVLVSQPVAFPDANLESAVLSALGKAPGTLTTVDLLDLTDLALTGGGVSNLFGLGAATNLTTLELDNGSIADLSPLASLSQLAWLSASNNLITDLSPLKGLASLGYLNLAYNPITNDSVLLSGFAGLTNLDLSGNSLSNLYFLTNLTGLSSLSLNNERISSGAALGVLSHLTSLSLSGNLLTNVSFLTNLTQLAFIDLSTNLLTDISPLKALSQLNQLALQKNLITNIAPLQQLNGAGYVNVGLNELDLSLNSSAFGVIGSLQSAGFSVMFLPQFPLDSDGDGMPDDWEIAHGLNPYDPSDALIDTDGDGMPNLVEYAVGTDPRNSTDAAEGIQVSLARMGGDNYIEIQFRERITPVRIQYIPEVSGDRFNWFSDSAHLEQIGVTAIDNQLSWVTVMDLTPVTVTSPRSFRLRITTN